MVYIDEKKSLSICDIYVRILEFIRRTYLQFSVYAMCIPLNSYLYVHWILDFKYYKKNIYDYAL